YSNRPAGRLRAQRAADLLRSDIAARGLERSGAGDILSANRPARRGALHRSADGPQVDPPARGDGIHGPGAPVQLDRPAPSLDVQPAVQIGAVNCAPVCLDDRFTE